MRSLSARKNGTALVIGAIPPNLKLLPSNRKHFILLDFFLFPFYFPFCLCVKKGNTVFRDVPADAVNTGSLRFPLCRPYSPFFQGIREMGIKCPSFFLLCIQFISLFCLFLGNGNKEGNKTVAAEPVLCMAGGTAAGTCTLPHMDG